ncbi:uncharacterized protein LOC122871906 isoform X5 [Siniperca chuatsi]|uniref:uncharacterized protein LOC122871906 isoform X5 n=1 Tax=Siniperca chuatsi TaxID=119488 RepID=UPI001CE11B71|nr:uncharacterized protein LOC122871906 isoform X5 [Siniperca chuatsi]
MFKIQNEEELYGQRKLLDAVFQPEVRLHRADVQLLLVSKEEDPLSSGTGAPVWTRRTHQSPHTLKRNQRSSGPVRRESSFEGWRKLIPPSSHSLLSL